MSDSLEFWRNNNELKCIYPIRENMGIYPDDESVIHCVKQWTVEPVIDYGCGFGRLAYLFSDYIGIDINPYAVKLAKQRYPEKQFIVDETLPIISGITSILFYAVLAHIEDRLRDILKAAGQYAYVIVAERYDALDERVPQYKSRSRRTYAQFMGKEISEYKKVGQWMIVRYI